MNKRRMNPPCIVMLSPKMTPNARRRRRSHALAGPGASCASGDATNASMNQTNDMRAVVRSASCVASTSGAAYRKSSAAMLAWSSVPAAMGAAPDMAGGGVGRPQGEGQAGVPGRAEQPLEFPVAALLDDAEADLLVG